MDRLIIGTSGYDYPEWKGVFYPADLKRADFLSWYALVFNGLELNFSFYSMPDAARLFSFYERSGGKLNFSVKVHQSLTHSIDCHWQDNARLFFNAAKPLLEKDVLGSLLFQFPQSFHYTRENRIYLSQLLQFFSPFPCAVEFRHAEWIKPSVFDGLNERNASIVFCDMPELKNLPEGKKTPFTGNQAYVRLHGRNSAAWYADGGVNGENGNNGSWRYDYSYSEEELSEFVPVVHSALEEKGKVQVYFNNHPKGSGALNAKSFRTMLQKRLT